MQKCLVDSCLVFRSALYESWDALFMESLKSVRQIYLACSGLFVRRSQSWGWKGSTNLQASRIDKGFGPVLGLETPVFCKSSFHAMIWSIRRRTGKCTKVVFWTHPWNSQPWPVATSLLDARLSRKPLKEMFSLDEIIHTFVDYY